MKVLNLYAGIGGNRKLWTDVDVTAVEINSKIACIYKDFFPQDNVVIADAHQYLLRHFEEYNFIWSSPPCPTHSKIRLYTEVAKGSGKPVYPKMELYEEILLLKYYFKGKWCVENVIAFYKPLIRPHELANHWFWANFHIPYRDGGCRDHHSSLKGIEERKGFNLNNYTGIDKRKILRNCVEPEIGLHILNESKRDIQGDLFR